MSWYCLKRFIFQKILSSILDFFLLLVVEKNNLYHLFCWPETKKKKKKKKKSWQPPQMIFNVFLISGSLKSLLLPQFSINFDAVCGKWIVIKFQRDLSEHISKFLPPPLLPPPPLFTPPQQIWFYLKIVGFWDKNFKMCSDKLLWNWVLILLPQTVSKSVKNWRRSSDFSERIWLYKILR